MSQAIALTYSHCNALWATLLVEELSRLGLTDCCLAPGSRSTPLTLAFASHDRITCHSHFDERGLGFFALGLAKAQRRPVALVTTSGTAVANLYPAVIEAHLTGVPLLILSADRPPELIGCGANQAISQPGIFAHYPSYQESLPTPDTRYPASFLLTTIDTAWSHLHGSQVGPVHINCMFAEPLYPGSMQDFSAYLAPLSRWLSSDRPWTQWQQQPLTATTADVAQWRAFTASPGLIIAGQLDSLADAKAVAQLAERLQWPLIADVQSQLRGHPSAIHFADQLLHRAEARQLLQSVDRVLQFGGRLLSKRLLQWLADQPLAHYWLIQRQHQRLDPDHRLSLRFVSNIAPWCRALPDVEPGAISPLMVPLRHQSGQIGQRIKAFTQKQRRLGEVALASELLLCLPRQGPLFLGNSLPARLVDMFALPDGQLRPVFANRGASGIDGLLATAAGCAEGSGDRLTLLIGDISFLHDLNSLALLRHLSLPPVVILLNNDGGSIFRLLPSPGDPRVARDFYQLPHGLNAEHAGGMFGLNYHCPHTLADFRNAYQAALADPVATLIEIQVPPEESSEQIRQFARELADYD